jgi:pimeloyl-ACP methyl ester carboxylesterase
LNPGNVPPGTVYTQTLYVNGLAQELPISCPNPIPPPRNPTSESPGLEIIPYEGYPEDSSGNVYVYNDNVPETYEIVCLGSNNCGSLSCSVLDNNVSISLSGQTYNTAFATFSAVTSTNPGTKQISCNLPNAYSPLVLDVYDAPPFITDAQLSAPLIPGGATVTLSIFGLHFGNSQGNGTLGVCNTGATPCTSTPDITFGSIIDWGCANPGYCQIDVPVTASAQPTGNGTYDVVVNAAGTGGSGFVAAPDGSQQRTVSIDRGHLRTQSQRPITVYLLHGIGQTGDNTTTHMGGAMDNLKATLTRIGSGLDQTRYVVDAGFSFGECSAVGNNCGVSQYGEKCSVDAGGKSLARYIGANPPQGQGDIVLIGYSMGGLIARDMIAKNYLTTVAGYTGGKVVGLITLGTPHLGYPYEGSSDDLIQCPQLVQDMAGGWAPLATPPQEFPPLGGTTFFDILRQSWGATSVPYWLATAGTVFTNSSRTFPTLGGGCMTPTTITVPPDQPYSDGVVCRDSALYQEPTGFAGWATQPFPTDTWQDPTHHYAHTLLSIYGSTPGINVTQLLFGTINTFPVYALYDPPAGLDLVNKIVSTLNAH